MKILVIGKSAREHAFIQKLSQSKNIETIYCVPGNPAIAQYAQCVNINLDDLNSILEFAKEKEVTFTIPLDEYVIEKGIANLFRQEKLKIFAPTVEAGQIATSRAFSKKFLYKHKIPLPKYAIFDRENSAIDYIKKSDFPLIIKYDYLTSQDSFVCKSFTQVFYKIKEVFNEVQKKVIIEEYLEGENITFSILTDGYNVLPLPYVKEYHHASDGGGGPLTKGTGAYCPSAKVTEKTEKFIANKIVFPVLDALQSSGTPYEGFLTMNLLLQKNGEVKLLDLLPTLNIPEATCILQLIEDDLADILYTAIEGALGDYYQNLNISDECVISTALMSGNYPNNPKTDVVVEGIEDLDEDNIELYYNDVGMNSYYEISTTGGRAFFMTAKAATLNKARADLYNNIDIIKFDGMHYRKDTGKFLISE